MTLFESFMEMAYKCLALKNCNCIAKQKHSDIYKRNI